MPKCTAILSIILQATLASAFLSNKLVNPDGKDDILLLYIRENETSVLLPDAVGSRNLTDCVFSLSFWTSAQPHPLDGKPLPFEKDGNSLQLVDGFTLNCEMQSVYDLQLDTVCPHDRTHSDHLRLHVTDINKHRPFFPQEVYETTYVEGEGQNYILKVVAYDQDCVTDHHACDYRIKTKHVPFQINSQGRIWPSQPLESSIKNKYQMEVVAVDCTGGDESEPAKVVVNVEPPCKSRFAVDTNSAFESEYPFSNLKLNLCAFCQPVDIVARISLEFDNPASIECGPLHCDQSNITTIDMLQAIEDTGEPKPDATYSFNGYDDYLDVTGSEQMVRSVFEGSGHLQFWMRQGKDPEPDTKRQIFCQSDASGDNSNHLELFTRHGLLSLVNNYHTPHGPAHHQPLSSSEWTWNLTDLSTGWHLFDLSFDMPLTNLTVDSQQRQAQSSHSEWPSTVHVQSSKPLRALSTIGACWQGKSERYVQNFYGDLAGLRFDLPRFKRNSCYVNCSQRMEMEAKRLLDSEGMFAFNSNKSVVIVRSHDVQSLRELMSSIRYYEQSDQSVSMSVALNGTVICKNMPKMKISDLWLRRAVEQHTKKIQHQSVQVDNQDQVVSGGDKDKNAGGDKKGMLKTTPGFLYSGWMLVGVLTLGSGIALTIVMTTMLANKPTHQRVPTSDDQDELQWDNVHFRDNPIRQQQRRRQGVPEEQHPVLYWSL